MASADTNALFDAVRELHTQHPTLGVQRIVNELREAHPHITKKQVRDILSALQENEQRECCSLAVEKVCSGRRKPTHLAHLQFPLDDNHGCPNHVLIDGRVPPVESEEEQAQYQMLLCEKLNVSFVHEVRALLLGKPSSDMVHGESDGRPFIIWYARTGHYVYPIHVTDWLVVQDLTVAQLPVWRAERQNAFAELSMAIEAVSGDVQEEKYRLLYQAAKRAFDSTA